VPYVELHARSAFSFLRGASGPETLAETAAAQGLPAMALLDRDGLAGVPRFHGAAGDAGVRARAPANVVSRSNSSMVFPGGVGKSGKR
jgi:error-prone DNA polymerase